MNDITKRDIQTFAKVLKEIAFTLEKRPELLIDFIEKNLPKDGTSLKIPSDFSERVQRTDLFGYAKEYGDIQLGNYLKDFSVEELKALMKKYSFGYTKLKSADSITALILDQVRKRTTDVFLTHEK